MEEKGMNVFGNNYVKVQKLENKMAFFLKKNVTNKGKCI